MKESRHNFSEIAEGRDNLAKGLRQLRENRDEKRAEGESPLNKIKNTVGFGPTQRLNSEADQLNEQSRDVLRTGKRTLAEDEARLIRDKDYLDLRKSLRRAVDALLKKDKEGILETISFLESKKELLDRGLKDPKQYVPLIEVLNELFVISEKRVMYPSSDDAGRNEWRLTDLYFFLDETLGSHLTEIDSHISSNLTVSESSLAALTEVLSSQTKSSKDKYQGQAIASALKHIDLVDSLPLGDSRVPVYALQNFISALFLTEESRVAVEEKLNNIFLRQRKDKEVLHALCGLAGRASGPEFSQFCRGHLQKIAESYGLNGEAAVIQWLSDGNNFGVAAEGNLNAINSLEAKHPGACALLQKQFGIADFRRYPEEMLLDQIEDRENRQIPHGLMAMPVADHNGAFSQDKEQFSKFYEQIKGNYLVDIFECQNMRDLAKALLKTKKGQSSKIPFAILGGHGQKDSIQLGNFSLARHITTEYLNGDSSKRIKDFFEDDATIILVSCSTGVNEGIGQRLSEKFGLTVIAPNTNTNLAAINSHEISPGHLRFDVKYGGGETMQYDHPKIETSQE